MCPHRLQPKAAPQSAAPTCVPAVTPSAELAGVLEPVLQRLGGQGDDGGAQQQEERPAQRAQGSRDSRRWRCPVTGALYEEVEADLEIAIREVRA
mgnify:CR=1 FL=1